MQTIVKFFGLAFAICVASGPISEAFASAKKAKSSEIHKSSKIFFVNKKRLRKDKVRKASTIDAIDFKEDGMLSKPFPDDFFDLSMSMYRDLVKPD